METYALVGCILLGSNLLALGWLIFLARVAVERLVHFRPTLPPTTELSPVFTHGEEEPLPPARRH